MGSVSVLLGLVRVKRALATVKWQNLAKLTVLVDGFPHVSTILLILNLNLGSLIPMTAII